MGQSGPLNCHMPANATTGNVSAREGDGLATKPLAVSSLVPYAKMNQRMLYGRHVLQLAAAHIARLELMEGSRR
ncbi:hypothetical protein BH23CHL4_BH23CHL4_02760 [soil metagenome]